MRLSRLLAAALAVLVLLPGSAVADPPAVPSDEDAGCPSLPDSLDPGTNPSQESDELRELRRELVRTCRTVHWALDRYAVTISDPLPVELTAGRGTTDTAPLFVDGSQAPAGPASSVEFTEAQQAKLDDGFNAVTSSVWFIAGLLAVGLVAGAILRQVFPR